MHIQLNVCVCVRVQECVESGPNTFNLSINLRLMCPDESAAHFKETVLVLCVCRVIG